MTRTGLHTVELDMQLPHYRVLLVIPCESSLSVRASCHPVIFLLITRTFVDAQRFYFRLCQYGAIRSSRKRTLGDISTFMQHGVVWQNVIPRRSFPRIHSLLATHGGPASSCPRHLPDYPRCDCVLQRFCYVSYIFHSLCRPDDFGAVFIVNLTLPASWPL